MDLDSLVVARQDIIEQEPELKPAFLDTEDGRIELARQKNGRLAGSHVIDWLPIEWADVIDLEGAIKELKPGIVAGFVRNGLFITASNAH